MCTLHSRITELCKERGISGSRMCLDLGLSKSTLSDLKSGRKKSFTAETAHKIASYLNVSVAYLLGEEEKDIKKEQPIEFDGLSKNRKDLIDFAMSISEEKAEKFLRVLKSLEEVDL